MFNSVFILQLKHILTKKNCEMYFRARKNNTFSDLCVFQNGNTCNFGINQTFSTIYVRFLWNYQVFSSKKRLILSKLLMFFPNKILILFSFGKLTTIWLKITLKCTSELEKLIYFQFFTYKTVIFIQCYGFMCVSM